MLIKTLISCMNRKSKNLLIILEIDVDNTNPIFNYPSIIKVFDYYNAYIKISIFLNLTRNEKKINMFFRELFKLIYNHSSSIRISLSIENQERYHVCNSLIFSEPSKVCDLVRIYSKFNSIQVTNCTNEEHLYHISSYCKQINQLIIYIRSSDDNYSLAALIKRAEIFLLRLNSNIYFDFNTIPEKIFNAIKGKLYSIKELKIELFKKFSIKILSECKMLRKLE